MLRPFRRRRSMAGRPRTRGQALVEFALVLPLFLMTLFGIIILGIGVFFQQQVTNAAREAARYAVLHSATSQCPTVSNLDPDAASKPQTYFRCDPPNTRWPEMTAFARGKIFGVPRSGVQLSACWSGYWEKDGGGNYSDYDALPRDTSPGGQPNDFRNCTIAAIDPGSGSTIAVDPRTDNEITCSAPMPLTGMANDMASNLSASYGGTANEVTVFACYNWQPPMAGFLLIPKTVTLRAVVTETLQYQQ